MLLIVPLRLFCYRKFNSFNTRPALATSSVRRSIFENAGKDDFVFGHLNLHYGSDT